MITKKITNELGINMFTINGPDILGKYYGQSETQLRMIFEKATYVSPSIIFIDEIDAIAPNRNNVCPNYII